MQRPFLHPSIDEISLEGLLYALADNTRLTIVNRIMAANGPLNCKKASPRGFPKSTLSHHYKVLREAGVIHSEKKGTEVINTLRAEELEARFPGVLDIILKAAEKESA